MKNLLSKIKTKSFWLSIAAGVILLLQNLGVKVDVQYVNEIVESVCALLLLTGVFTAPCSTLEKPTEGIVVISADKTKSGEEKQEKEDSKIV